MRRIAHCFTTDNSVSTAVLSFCFKILHSSRNLRTHLHSSRPEGWSPYSPLADMLRISALRAQDNQAILLVDLPLDIITLVRHRLVIHERPLTLIQILYYFLPVDLLYFSWTCRAAYTTLKSPGLRFIWKRARSNYTAAYIAYPPKGMSEGTYARLLFYRKCSVSLNALTFVLNLRVMEAVPPLR